MAEPFPHVTIRNLRETNELRQMPSEERGRFRVIDVRFAIGEAAEATHLGDDLIAGRVKWANGAILDVTGFRRHHGAATIRSGENYDRIVATAEKFLREHDVTP